ISRMRDPSVDRRPFNEFSVELHPEPLSELFRVRARAPHSRRRRAKVDALLDPVRFCPALRFVGFDAHGLLPPSSGSDRYATLSLRIITGTGRHATLVLHITAPGGDELGRGRDRI